MTPQDALTLLRGLLNRPPATDEEVVSPIFYRDRGEWPYRVRFKGGVREEIKINPYSKELEEEEGSWARWFLAQVGGLFGMPDDLENLPSREEWEALQTLPPPSVVQKPRSLGSWQRGKSPGSYDR